MRLPRQRSRSARRSGVDASHRHRMSTCRGYSLTGMLLSVSLCMPLVMSAISLTCEALREQVFAEQLMLLEQDAQFALMTISKLVQLAGHQDPATAGFVVRSASMATEPPVRGLDDASLAARSSVNASPSGPGIFGSDVLILRFSGMNSGGSALLNCAGIPVSSSAAASDEAGNTAGYSILYIGRGTTGEPELRCKYPTANGWDSEALVSGVESFQVLYGLDRDGDGHPDQFLRASAIAAESGNDAAVLALWQQVVALKIAVLIRSAQSMKKAPVATRWDLFGEAYSALHAAQDRGTQLLPTDFTGDSRYRLRRVYEQLIFLRNTAPSVE